MTEEGKVEIRKGRGKRGTRVKEEEEEEDASNLRQRIIRK